jgi:hypothetical protein
VTPIESSPSPHEFAKGGHIHDLPQPKLLLDSVTGSGSATNAGTFTSANIDTLGVDYVSIDISATTQSASTQAGSPSVLKIQESDTTVVTSFADVVGFRGGSATATNVDFVVGDRQDHRRQRLQVQRRCPRPQALPQRGCLADHHPDLPGHRQRLPRRAVALTPAKAGVLNLVEG